MAADLKQKLEQRRLKQSGSVEVVTPEQLALQAPGNLGEILVRIPSVQYIDEDGRGTKPNVGIRGLNPQRSQFTLLLHDGVPVQPSMYSENAGYYGVPAERVGGIEVIKGGAALRHGPHTVGGVVNFLSRDISSEPMSVTLDTRYDSNGSYLGNIAVNGTIDRLQYSVEYMHSGGSGFRDNLGFEIDDLDIRLAYQINDIHRVIGHFAYYDEMSETPGGLLPSEFAHDPSFSSKPNDNFYGNRVAGDIRTISQFDENNRLELLFYASYFSRDWYLQNYANANSTSNALANNNEQALRDFAVIGFEPKYSLKYELGSFKDNELTLGGRFYRDDAKRRTKTGNSGRAREDNSVLKSSDYLTTTVYAGWLENRFQITDKFAITPGVR
ncbi:hypothetical protein GCM10023213_28260 [Prosthecobacter algae]|uniref:TonB-dependent receptor plug domain-containing protein n=1 Tax=Prosthecobacter algae TaxID=1144682 RepID=A0ABP9P889_9BACT